MKATHCAAVSISENDSFVDKSPLTTSMLLIQLKVSAKVSPCQIMQYYVIIIFKAEE